MSTNTDFFLPNRIPNPFTSSQDGSSSPSAKNENRAFDPIGFFESRRRDRKEKKRAKQDSLDRIALELHRTGLESFPAIRGELLGRTKKHPADRSRLLISVKDTLLLYRENSRRLASKSDALTAKVESQTQRIRELELLLAEERTARQSADLRYSQVLEMSTRLILSDRSARAQSSSLDPNCFRPETRKSPFAATGSRLVSGSHSGARTSKWTSDGRENRYRT